MLSVCNPAPVDVTEEMLEVASLALTHRPGEKPVQNASRARQMVHAALAFAPRDPGELMLAVMTFGHYDMVLEVMKAIHAGMEEKSRFRALAAIGRLDTGFMSALRMLRAEQARPLARGGAASVLPPGFVEALTAAAAAAEAEPEPPPAPVQAPPVQAPAQTVAARPVQPARVQTAARSPSPRVERAAPPAAIVPDPATRSPIVSAPALGLHPATGLTGASGEEAARLRSTLLASVSSMAATRGLPAHPVPAAPTGQSPIGQSGGQTRPAGAEPPGSPRHPAPRRPTD
jgi:hypothetical protein